MRRVVIDASALASLIFDEEPAGRLAAQLAGASVFAPPLLKFELTNVAVTKARRDPAQAAHFFAAVAIAVGKSSKIRWHDVDTTDVALIAKATRLSAYDASYLWLAGTLGADLVTLDKKLAAAIE